MSPIDSLELKLNTGSGKELNCHRLLRLDRFYLIRGNGYSWLAELWIHQLLNTCFTAILVLQLLATCSREVISLVSVTKVVWKQVFSDD